MKNKIKLKVTDAFHGHEEWKKDHLIIRKEAYNMGIKYPVVLASINTKIAYVFEGARTNRTESFSPISA